MQINLTFDQIPNEMPAGFVADVEYVAKLFDSLFSNPVTINLDIGWGEARGLPIYPGFIGEPDPTHYYTESYADVRAALLAEGAPGAAGLPNAAPLPGDLRLSQVQAKALGFTVDDGVDAYVGFSSSSIWSFAIPGQSGSGAIGVDQDECVSLIEHEFTEAMGRRSDLQGEITYYGDRIDYGLGQPFYYTPMDLYRYRAPGVLDTPDGESLNTAYFSLDGGVTRLGVFDSHDDRLDHGDWYPTGPTADGNDAFNAYPLTGVWNPLSQVDLELMAASGWTIDATPPSLSIVSAAFTSGGQLVLSGAASDAGGVSGVEIFEGSTDLGAAAYDDATGAWSFQTALSAGVTANLYAVATDGADNQATASTTLTDLGAPLTAYDAAGFAYLIESGQTAVEVVDTAADVAANQPELTALAKALRLASVTAVNPDGSQSVTTYDGALIAQTVVTGVVGARYSSYQYDYVGGLFDGAQYTFTQVRAGAAFSSYETDFDHAGAYAGLKLFYAGKEADYDAAGQLAAVITTAVSNEPYYKLERDYAAGVYVGRKAFYHDVGGYTGSEVDRLANGDLAKVVESGITGAPYQTLQQDYANGALVDAVYGYADPPGGPFASHEVTRDANGRALARTLDLADGGHRQIALSSGQTLTSLGDDKLIGNSATTFALSAVYGADTIIGFNADDTLLLPSGEFAELSSAIQTGAYSAAAAVLSFTDGDSLRFRGLTEADLVALTARIAAR